VLQSGSRTNDQASVGFPNAAAFALATNLWQQALADYDRVLSWVDHFPALAPESRRLFLSQRRELRLKFGRESEALADGLEFLGVPVRSPQAGPQFIDLSLYYNGALDPTLRPTGVRRLFGGTEFDLRGRILLGATQDGLWPGAVTGLRIGQKCERLEFLYRIEMADDKKDADFLGQVTSTFVIHFANGDSSQLEVRIGDDAWDYIVGSEGPRPTKHSITAWTGPIDSSKPAGKQGQIFQSTWNNPHPEVEVTSVDFVSSLNNASPCLYAITVGQP
jgi:hypothetical protein